MQPGAAPSPGSPFVLGEAGTAAGVPDRHWSTEEGLWGPSASVPAQSAALAIRQPFSLVGATTVLILFYPPSSGVVLIKVRSRTERH